MTTRTVRCSKFNQELPGLAKPPFPGEIGERIFNEVSEKAWKMWKEDMQIKVLNEYRLNMADPKDYETLVNQMMIFLNLSSGEGKEVENATRGRG